MGKGTAVVGRLFVCDLSRNLYDDESVCLSVSVSIYLSLSFSITIEGKAE